MVNLSKKRAIELLHPCIWRHHDRSKRRKSLSQRNNFVSQTTWIASKVATIATKTQILHFAGISLILLTLSSFLKLWQKTLWSWRGMMVGQLKISHEKYRRRPWSNLKQALLSWYFFWQTGNHLSHIKQSSNRDFEPETSSTIDRRVTDCVSLHGRMRRECEEMGRTLKTEENWQLPSRVRVEFPSWLCLEAVIKPARVEFTVENSWWWAKEMPETFRVFDKIKFWKFVRLVGFIKRRLITY
jgi:hypothetical protein